MLLKKVKITTEEHSCKLVCSSFYCRISFISQLILSPNTNVKIRTSTLRSKLAFWWMLAFKPNEILMVIKGTFVFSCCTGYYFRNCFRQSKVHCSYPLHLHYWSNAFNTTSVYNINLLQSVTVLYIHFSICVRRLCKYGVYSVDWIAHQTIKIICSCRVCGFVLIPMKSHKSQYFTLSLCWVYFLLAIYWQSKFHFFGWVSLTEFEH